MRPTVRRVRRDEGRLLRTTRLAALQDSPSAFSSSYEGEARRSEEEWTQRARSGADAIDRVTFFAVLDDRVVGLIGGHRPEPGGSLVELVSMWTAPEARRAGVGRSLVRAVVEWAGSVGATTVALGVVGGNEAAYGLYRSMGFQETGDRRPLASDPGKDEVRMTLAL